jgi:hypothetical protein
MTIMDLYNWAVANNALNIPVQTAMDGGWDGIVDVDATMVVITTDNDNDDRKVVKIF